MKEALHHLADLVAKANDSFFIKHPNVDTLMGIMDKTLRKQGLKADAITLECLSLNKKIVILVHDNKPTIIDVALGNKAGEIFSSSQYLASELTEDRIIAIMERNFLKSC